MAPRDSWVMHPSTPSPFHPVARRRRTHAHTHALALRYLHFNRLVPLLINHAARRRCVRGVFFIAIYLLTNTNYAALWSCDRLQLFLSRFLWPWRALFDFLRNSSKIHRCTWPTACAPAVLKTVKSFIFYNSVARSYFYTHIHIRIHIHSHALFCTNDFRSNKCAFFVMYYGHLFITNKIVIITGDNYDRLNKNCCEILHIIR